MKRLLTLAALLSVAASVAAPTAVWGQDYGRPSFGAGRNDQDGARNAPRPGRQTSLAKVLAMIGQRTPGRHLNTTQAEVGGRPAYFVQWQMPDGRVVIFMVDAETGQILGRQGG